MRKPIEVRGIRVLLCENYEGGALRGRWQVTLKVDGVRCLLTPEGAFSRNGKPLHNLPRSKIVRDVEVFCGSFKETISRVKSHEGEPIGEEHLYDLREHLDGGRIQDERLHVTWIDNPSEADIIAQRDKAIEAGHEGLVLRQGDHWIKVKRLETYDVLVTGVVAGLGKHEGRMGALATARGNVGTGFSDREREEFNHDGMIGRMIEVACMELTESDQFRHPRFVALRTDKE